MHEFYIQILSIFFNFLFNFYDFIRVLFLSFGFLNGFLYKSTIGLMDFGTLY